MAGGRRKCKNMWGWSVIFLILPPPMDLKWNSPKVCLFMHLLVRMYDIHDIVKHENGNFFCRCSASATCFGLKLPHALKNHSPAMFHTAAVRPKR